MHVRSKTTFTNCQCIQKSSFLEMIIGNSPEVFLLKLLSDRDPEPKKPVVNTGPVLLLRSLNIKITLIVPYFHSQTVVSNEIYLTKLLR